MIHFVGAGSGAVDLITIRGQRLLQKADVIIYAGSLVNPDLLQFAKSESVVVHNSAYMTLEDVIEVMLQAEKNQQTTVRLHTGDPSLYGAIREQMQALDQHGIAYDVVPGVSSFSAAAAALGAEYTLPGVSQTLILTRMAGRTPVPESEKIEHLALHGCSMAVFLSAAQLEALQSELLKGAYQESTPVAIVYKASWPDELCLLCTVGTLAQCGKENNIEKTALILVGDFLGDTFERSKLYDPEFTTVYRKGETHHAD